MRAGLMAIGLMWIAGCGPRAPLAPPSGDAAILRSLVTELADATDDPQRFKNFFANHAAPADAERVRYQRLNFDPVETAKIDGTTATIKVEVGDSKTPPKGPVEWIFVKEGERWKLKSAPLP